MYISCIDCGIVSKFNCRLAHFVINQRLFKFRIASVLTGVGHQDTVPSQYLNFMWGITDLFFGKL